MTLMDTTHPTGPDRTADDLAAVADDLLRQLAEIDAAEAPAVAGELAANLTVTLDLREAADAPSG